MSLRDLRQLRLLKPEREWSDTLTPHRTAACWSLLWAIVAGGGCVFMVTGDGGPETWWGLAAFGVALVGFVRSNVISITDAKGD